MSKIVHFPLKEKKPETKPTGDMKKVLSEMHEETGIDFLKVITGDEKELKKLKFKQYQDAAQFQ